MVDSPRAPRASSKSPDTKEQLTMRAVFEASTGARSSGREALEAAAQGIGATTSADVAAMFKRVERRIGVMSHGHPLRRTTLIGTASATAPLQMAAAGSTKLRSPRPSSSGATGWGPSRRPVTASSIRAKLSGAAAPGVEIEHRLFVALLQEVNDVNTKSGRRVCCRLPKDGRRVVRRRPRPRPRSALTGHIWRRWDGRT